MRVLLDTHVLLWWLTNDPKLSMKARQLVQQAQGDVYVSSVSLWELVTKEAQGKLPFQASVVAQAVRTQGMLPPPSTDTHALTVATLPPIHSDPFDRALIAQSVSEPLILLTSDAAVAQYGGNVRLV